MIRHTLIHPGLLGALARAGHGSRILLGDGNYPVSTAVNQQAERIHLNLRPGMVEVEDALSAILSATPIESATVMAPDDGSRPEAHVRYQAILGGMALQSVDRSGFYSAARGPDVAAVVATGDTRLYANILLTIGVVDSEASSPQL